MQVRPLGSSVSSRCKESMKQPSNNNLARPVGWETCTHAELMLCEGVMFPDNKHVDCAQLNTLLSLMQQTGRASGRSTHVKQPSNKRGICNMCCTIGQLHCRYVHAGVQRT